MCLSEATLLALASGRLAEGELAAATEHVRACERCAGALRQAQQKTFTGTARTQNERPSREPARNELRTVSGPMPTADKIGPYVLLDLLAEGGMGAVYTAYHPELDRKVAVKLLRAEHTGGEPEAALQARLLREAQAMARLDHPNVVAVHDAGEFQNKVYLVMDLVEGLTLKAWLSTKRRGWREVLEAFVQAGHGLAAAHAAGVVHRDFKPSNVLVGKDGRVRVTDFGIARAVDQPPEPIPTPTGPMEQTVIDHVGLSTPITQPGAVMGTPRYMAPEQFKGQPADPRTDQFSFCVALYEALCGELPFEKAFDLRPSQKVREPPTNVVVPRFVRRTLLRGLSLSPGARFDSMNALLAALGKDPARRALVALLAITGAALVIAVAWLGARALRPATVVGCEDLGRELTGVWDAQVRQTLSAALTHVGAKGVDAATQDLDRYAVAWTGMHRAACQRAVTVQGDETLLLELTCLARQKTDLEALVGVLGHADADIASQVAVAIRSLIPPDRCAGARGLGALPRPPADPKIRAEAEELRLRLSSASFEAALGNTKGSLEMLGSIVQRARELGQRPLEAEALYAQGVAQGFVGDDKAATSTLREAASVAEASGADLVAAEAAASLSKREAQTNVTQARQRLQEARAWVERIGGDPYVEGLIENTATSLPDETDEAAIRHAEKAAQLMEEALGPTHPRTLMYRCYVGNIQASVGRSEDAVRSLTEVIRQMDELGVGGPQTLGCLGSLAGAEISLGQLGEAEALLARGQLAIDPASAERSTWNAYLLENLAALRGAQGRIDEALALVRHAEQVVTRSQGSDSELYGETLALEGELLEEKGQHAEAVGLLRRANQLLARLLGPNSGELCDSLESLGAAQIALGNWSAGLPLLDRALALANQHRPYAGQVAAIQLASAKAMLAKGDRPRAVALVGAARAELVQIPWKKRQLDELDDWVRAKRLK